MQFIAIKSKYILLTILLSFGLSAAAFAGEEGEEDIKREVSYLSKKLLDLSGKDNYTVNQPPMVKPFIGICTSMLAEGIKLTCITPDSQAAKAGLATGDLVRSINGVKVAGQKSHKEGASEGYWAIMKKMKIGDVLTFELSRGGEEKKISVTVGSLSHPGYTLDIKRK